MMHPRTKFFAWIILIFLLLITLLVPMWIYVPMVLIILVWALLLIIVVLSTMYGTIYALLFTIKLYDNWRGSNENSN